MAGRLLLVVLEEETDPARFSIHRLAHYCLDLAELYGTDRVVPVVIFLREARGLPDNLKLGGDRLTYLAFHYLKCALASLDASQYLDSPNLVAQGELNVLLRQLTRRFGPLDAAIEQRLRQAGSDDLERWADNILDAQTLDEVFARH